MTGVTHAIEYGREQDVVIVAEWRALKQQRLVMDECEAFGLADSDGWTIVIKCDERAIAANEGDFDRQTGVIAITISDSRRQLQVKRAVSDQRQKSLLVEDRQAFSSSVIDGKELIDSDLGVRRIVRVCQRNTESNVLIVGRRIAVANKPADKRIRIDLHQLDCALRGRHVFKRRTDERGCGQARADVLGREHQLQQFCNAAVGSRTIRTEVDIRIGEQACQSTAACR